MTLSGTYAGHPALTWSKPALFGHFISGGEEFLPSLTTMGPGSYKKTVILNLAEVSASVSRNEVIKALLHTVSKFRPQFGLLYWSSTWQSLPFFPLDRPVADVAWKITHGVLYTADRLCSYDYDVPRLCLCGHAPETLPHLFFACLAQCFSVVTVSHG